MQGNTSGHPEAESALQVAVPFEIQYLVSHLLRRAHFTAEAAFPDAYQGLEVTSRQLALLFAINRNPGANQTQLAEAVGLDANTFSDLAKRSERKGLLKRIRTAEDKRAFGLFLTQSGLEMVTKSIGLTHLYQDTITSRLSAEERQQLVKMLRKMMDIRSR